MAEEMDLNMDIMHKSDLHELHKRIKAEPVDVVIGHSKGKYIAEDEGIPLVRVGFPVEDRFGYHRRAVVGYRGSINLVDEITNAILANKMVVSNTVMEKGSMGPTSKIFELDDIAGLAEEVACGTNGNGNGCGCG
jgi:nitrogenase molybdenum-iron protein beta chain